MYEVMTTLLVTEQDNRGRPSYNWCQETLLFSAQQLKTEFTRNFTSKLVVLHALKLCWILTLVMLFVS